MTAYYSVSFNLEGIVRVAENETGGRLTRHVLHRMHELMQQQVAPALAIWSPIAWREEDVRTLRKGLRAKRVRFSRLGMYAHPTEVVIEAFAVLGLQG